MSTIFDKINPGKMLSDGLLTMLGPALGMFAPHAPAAISKIKSQIEAGTATKDQIKGDIHAVILTVEDVTPDAVDTLLETFGRMVDDAFLLAEQWPLAFPAKA